MDERILTQQEHDELAVDAVFKAIGQLECRARLRGPVLRRQLPDLADAADRLNALVVKLSDSPSPRLRRAKQGEKDAA